MKMSDFRLIKISPPPKYKALFLKVAFIKKVAFNMNCSSAPKEHIYEILSLYNYANLSLHEEAKNMFFLSCQWEGDCSHLQCTYHIESLDYHMTECYCCGGPPEYGGGGAKYPC